MRVKDSYDETLVYLEDQTSDTYPYQKAVSKIDETNLKQIAKDMNIEYINMSKQSNITNKISEIKRKIETEGIVDDTSSYTDIYYIFAVPLLVLLVMEFINYKKNL